MYPFVSIIIAVLNEEHRIENCLNSIVKQTYPRERFEVLIIDGGSTDATVSLCEEYMSAMNLRVLKNERVIAEFGKSIGIQAAQGDVLVLLDADNEIVQMDWLGKMIIPLQQEDELLGVESWYLRAPGDHPLSQYLTNDLHISDPMARRLAPTLTPLYMRLIGDTGVTYTVYQAQVGFPTGANGFVMKRHLIDALGGVPRRFDESTVITHAIRRLGWNRLARVVGYGIYHHYVDSWRGYVRKRLKIGRKFSSRKTYGEQTWVERNGNKRLFASAFYNGTFVGPLFEAIGQYMCTGNTTWFYHPFVSFLTVLIYGYALFEVRVLGKQVDISVEPQKSEVA